MRSSLLPALAAMVVMATVAPSAGARPNHYYCGSPNVVHAGTACWSGYEEDYADNYVAYQGTGSVSFCERLGAAPPDSPDSFFYSYICASSPTTIHGTSGDCYQVCDLYPQAEFGKQDEVESLIYSHTYVSHSFWP